MQLSLTVTPPRTFGIAAWQVAFALALVAAGQLTIGAVVSLTVTCNEQVELFPLVSLAVYVTVVTPLLNT